MNREKSIISNKKLNIKLKGEKQPQTQNKSNEKKIKALDKKENLFRQRFISLRDKNQSWLTKNKKTKSKQRNIT